VAGLAAAFGSGAMTNSIAEIEHAKAILVTGSNTSEDHPVIAMRIKKAVREHGAKLIVADPRHIDLVDYSEVWLRQRPGTDVALFNAIMNVIVKESLEAKDYITERTEGFEDLKKTLEEYTPKAAQKITGVPAGDIVKAAHIIAGNSPFSIIYAMGITQHTHGTDNVKSLANLSLLTGNVGVESGGVNPLRGQNNVQGACDMAALPNVFPGYQKVDNPDLNAKFAKAWGLQLSDKPGLTLVEMVNEVFSGKIKALYIFGENPAISDPNLNHSRKALEKVDFLVVQDLFLTETAKYADVVLPGASFAEKNGTFTNTERRVQKVRKAVDPPGQARPVLREINTLTPSYAGITGERLDTCTLQWPCPAEDHPGTKFLHSGQCVRGKGKFHAVKYIESAELPDKDYPLILTTGRVLYQFHTGTMTRRAECLESVSGTPFVEISKDDAGKLGISKGDMVRLRSRRGETQAKALVGDMVDTGVVFMPFHYKEAAVNLLTNDKLDPVAKIPELKVCAVALEKV
jgi:predicted molibdopterin-dependent oxidoreductase YjgC